MDNKILFQKLNNLKKIQPDNEWKNSCREILFSQISNGQKIEELEQEKLFSWKIFFNTSLPQWISVEKTRIAWIGYPVMFLLLSCGLVSVYASRNINPQDSLYIAKIINEKAQFAITFDEKEKTKLNLEFATNRAKEIEQLSKETKEITETENIKQDKNKIAQKLTSNFKKEISQAKSRLNKINIINPISNKKVDDNQQFFSANLGKDNKSIEISEQVKTDTKVDNKKNIINEEQKIETIATTTVENLVKDDSNVTNKILEQAEKLFNEKNYSESINKLKEINTVIDQVNN